MAASIEVAVAVAAVLVARVLALLKARSAAASRRRPFLDATQWKPLRLAERKELTHNTRLFR